MLQRTLLLAQRAADDAVNEAQARAKQILEESEAKAQSLVSDAEATARRIAEGERRRLEAEMLDLSARREQLRADADALEEYVAGYRDRIRAGDRGRPREPRRRRRAADGASRAPRRRDPRRARARAHCRGRRGHRVAPGRPHPSGAGAEPDVDLTDAADAGGSSGDDAWESGPATRAIGGLDRRSPTAVGARPVRSRGVGAPVTGRRAAAARARRVAAARTRPPMPRPRRRQRFRPVDTAPQSRRQSSWLSSSDSEWASSSEVWDAPAPWERDGAATAAAPHPPSRSRPTCRWRPTPIDTDSLDDDAFFASLREAVRDDAPLGPRDDEQAHVLRQQLRAGPPALPPPPLTLQR